MDDAQPQLTVWHIGGSDVYMRVPLLLKLRSRGFRVGAVGSEDHELFRQHDIPFLHYPLADRANPWSDWQARKSLTNLFRSQQPDVIHAFDTRPAILAPLAAHEASVPGRIRTITGMGRLFSTTSAVTMPMRQAYCFLQRKVSKSCMTVFQNQDDQQYFRSNQLVHESNHAIVPGSGIDLEQIAEAAGDRDAVEAFRSEYGLEGKIVVTMTARLIWQKGVREYLQAAASIAAKRDDVAFLLVGPLSDEGRKAISREEIESFAPTVQYLGSRNDIPTILAATDVFALPSYYREGVPRVLLEAGALSIPLITTDAPGCRDVVRHEQEGLIVAAKDSQDLANAIVRLADDEQLRTQYGTACRQRIEANFSLDRVADAYATIYRQSLKAA